MSILPPAPAGPKYVRRTVYLYQGLAYEFRELAVSESWELAGLARVMIMVGLTIREPHEAEEEIRSQHELIIGLNMLHALTLRVGCRLTRPYRMRGVNRKGVWITVHLLAGFLTHVAT